MENLILVNDDSGLMKVLDYVSDKEFIAFDIETTGVSKQSEVIGLSVCADVDTAYYVALKYWDVDQKKLIDFEVSSIKKLLHILKSKKLIMHNGIFDCSMIENNFNISLIDSLHTDTMVLAHLINENRTVGLKDLSVSIYGEDSKKEQLEMKESVTKNGGVLTKSSYELYKADWQLVGKYGAKDTILTLKLFYHLIPELYEQKLDAFFYEDESMPLLKGPTYHLNTTGLRVDAVELQRLKIILETECIEAKAFIYQEIDKYIKSDYPGTHKTNTFNIGSSKQLSWLLYHVLGNEFGLLTNGGKELCKAMDIPIPYSPGAKKDFIRTCSENRGQVYYTMGSDKAKKVGDYWTYIACGKESISKIAQKYKWAQKFLEYAKNLKLLNTYVEGIQERAIYNTIYPSFLQHGTTSGRYSSRNPNFQNLPRGDKRIKECIVSRPGNVFVGADYSQLEPRVFAFFSQDKRLMECFRTGDDFYSVIGVEVFGKKNLSLKKDEENSFAKKYPELRDISKVIGLSATYGTTAFKMASAIKKSANEAQNVIDEYFKQFSSVKLFMNSCHDNAKTLGRVENLFGRPRRLPQALNITKIYGNAKHSDLPYEIRNVLNLSVNHVIQSTGASIMNRAAIKLYNRCKELASIDKDWNNVKLVLQVHDELVLEGPKKLQEQMMIILKDAMENTVELPGVTLTADPKAGTSLAQLK